MAQAFWSRLAATAFRYGAAAALASAAVLPARADYSDDAKAACGRAVQERGALTIDEAVFRRESGDQIVQGRASFPDAAGVAFRCRIYNAEVLSVLFLVQDEKTGGWTWVRSRTEETGATAAAPVTPQQDTPPDQTEATPAEASLQPVVPAFKSPGGKATGPASTEAAGTGTTEAEIAGRFRRPTGTLTRRVPQADAAATPSSGAVAPEFKRPPE